MSRHYRCAPDLAFAAGRAHGYRTEALFKARAAADRETRALFVKHAKGWHRDMMTRLAGRWI